jgi:hypothetical protein
VLPSEVVGMEVLKWNFFLFEDESNELNTWREESTVKLEYHCESDQGLLRGVCLRFYVVSSTFYV